MNVEQIAQPKYVVPVYSKMRFIRHESRFRKQAAKREYLQIILCKKSFSILRLFLLQKEVNK